MTVLVTGGAGFIGSALVRELVLRQGVDVVTVDKLTYAGDLRTLAGVRRHPRHALVRADIGDAAAMRAVFRRHRPDAVVHLAAETHVDRSIDGPEAFLHTNVAGTFTLLEAALAHYRGLRPAVRQRFRFLHVSTDEVYGSLGARGRFSEESPYAPNSPYSATKAASDHLVRAWHHTYGLPIAISNCSNNFGPYQHPEKLIPLMILNAVEGRTLPVYGRGRQVRDWLYVEDHARALYRILRRGRIGEQYNVGGNNERRNIDVVREICSILDELRPGRRHAGLIRFIEDRPGHDQRYAIDARKIRRELGWSPRAGFSAALRRTVQWYLDHPDWAQRSDRARLGLGRRRIAS